MGFMHELKGDNYRITKMGKSRQGSKELIHHSEGGAWQRRLRVKNVANWPGRARRATKGGIYGRKSLGGYGGGQRRLCVKNMALVARLAAVAAT